MPSCDATDVFTKSMRGGTLSSRSLPAPGDQTYCEEVAQGRPRCPPGKCRYGGQEHDQVSGPGERPFGRDLAPGRSVGKRKKPGKGKKATRKPARKTAARKPARKSPRKTKRAPKKTKR